eukprot:1153592-Pelagomonas_calceolata.AAC.2
MRWRSVFNKQARNSSANPVASVLVCIVFTLIQVFVWASLQNAIKLGYTKVAPRTPLWYCPAVKKLAVEKSERENSGSFEKVFEVGEFCAGKCTLHLLTCTLLPYRAELASRGDRLQTEVHQVTIRAKYLKFTLLSGHCENAAVNR